MTQDTYNSIKNKQTNKTFKLWACKKKKKFYNNQVLKDLLFQVWWEISFMNISKYQYLK